MTQILEQIAQEGTPASVKGDEVCLDDFALKQIRHYGRKLARQLSVNDDDAMDLQQDLTLRLLQSANDFDSNKAKWQTFVVQVLTLASKSLLRKSLARREHPCWNPISQQELEATAGPNWEEYLPPARDTLEMVEQQMDMETVIRTMPKKLQQICWEVLFHGNATAAAESLGLSQSAVQRAVERIREYFVRAGLAPCWFDKGAEEF